MQENKISILIADDETNLLSMVSKIFERRGHRVMAVDSGHKAVEEVKKQKFDLALIDIKMSGINGVETFRQIKKLSPQTTVIMMTGASVEDLVKEALDEGAYTVIYKPFKVEELIKTINKTIKQKLIIVTDAQVENHNKIEEVFKKQGYCTVNVNNESEAVKELKSDKYEVALINVKVLTMDKLRALEEFKKKQTQIGMIMLSGYSQDEFIDKCMKEGIDAYLHKPFDMEKFIKASEKAHAKSVARKEERILLIEDDESLKEMLSLILARAGYSIIAVAEGSLALKEAEKGFINLAVIDFNLPDMSGIEVARKLRRINFNTCVILMTAHASLEMAVEAIKEDIDEYLIKPVDPGLLKRSIKKALEKQHLIIENKKLLEDLGMANKELKKLDELKSYFLSMVTHELCTPLNSIGGYTDLLLNEGNGKLSANQMDFLQTIKKENNTLCDLINDLLDLSRIEAGKLKLVFETCSIAKIIQMIVKRHKFKLEEKKIKLEVNISDALPDVTIDCRRVAQVISNLITNAIKFTPQEGNISILAYLKEDLLRIEVVDNGRGIEAKEIPKIFDRFYQVKKWKDGRKEGLGLGMAITKEIIQAHNGEIRVESEGEGKGSKFWFSLPVYGDSAG